MTTELHHDLRNLGIVISVTPDIIVVRKDTPEKITTIIDGIQRERFHIRNIINVGSKNIKYRISSETMDIFKAEPITENIPVVREDVYLSDEIDKS